MIMCIINIITISITIIVVVVVVSFVNALSFYLYVQKHFKFEDFAEQANSILWTVPLSKGANLIYKCFCSTNCI